MPDTKITALTAITTVDPAADVLPIVDISDTSMAASGTTKKITSNQILGAGGTATLASATITGDLTVDTSTLKVDSTNNRVGVGTATPADTLDVNGRVTALRYLSSSSNAALPSFAVSAGNGAYNSGANEIGFSINSTSAMTLNSTGLGVGGAPISGFRLNVNNGDFRVSDVQNEDGVEIGWSAGAGSGFVQAYNRTTSAFKDLVLNSAVTINTSGNVGIGVTPSAWNSAFGSVLQFKSAGSSAGGSLTGSSADNFRMFSNTYYDGAYKYIAAGFATQYEQSAGSHVWYLSGTTAGAINGTITFSNALSLDKTGSLVLGAAAVATTATDGFLYIPGCAGTPTGTPTAKTGRVPLVVDTTNNKLYFYSGGAWVAAN